jgi:hypothetical protein
MVSKNQSYCRKVPLPSRSYSYSGLYCVDWFLRKYWRDNEESFVN